jgi:putrescine aminotransferase
MSDKSRIDAVHHLRPFSDPRVIEKQGPMVIVRGEGCFIEDDAGRRYLDGMAGLWCMQVGHGRRELIDAATRQMEKLAYYNTFFGTTTEPLAELVDVLRDLTPGELDWFVFGNSGSEAVDSAVRLVRHYWASSGAPEKKIVIGRTFGYHGSTMAAASIGGMAGMHAQGGLPLPDFEHIPPPYPFVDCPDADPDALDAYGRRAADALEEKITELGAHRVAAFIGEPVLGAGGVIVPPDSYWPRIQEICREHDVLLVADEVICGFGRTGRTFGCGRYEIEPDLMTMAKGLTSGYFPMSALAIGPRVAACIRDGGVLQHGFTYSGHPVGAAVALANLKVIADEGLVERAGNESGPRLQAELASLTDLPMVGEVRGVGMIAGLELVRDGATRERFEPAGRAAGLVRDRCLEEGLVVRQIREGLAVCPPLTISDEEIGLLGERLRSGIERAADELGR